MTTNIQDPGLNQTPDNAHHSTRNPAMDVKNTVQAMTNDTAVSPSPASSFFELEQQLTHHFVELGHDLKEEGAVDAMTRFHASLDAFIAHSRFQKLADWFELEPIELRMIALVYIQQVEPDSVAVFLGTSWFEQGPTLSLDKLLLLVHHYDDKHVLLEADVFRSVLFQYGLIQQAENRPGFTLPCFLAHFLLDYLSSDNASPLTDTIFCLHANYEQDPVYQACFQQSAHIHQASDLSNQWIQLSDTDKQHALWFTEQRSCLARQLLYISQAKAEHHYTNRQLLNWLAHLILSAEGQPVAIWWPDFPTLIEWDYAPFIQALKNHPNIQLFFLAPSSNNCPQLLSMTDFPLVSPTLDQIAHGWLALAPHDAQTNVHQAKSLAERYPVAVHRMADLARGVTAQGKSGESFWTQLQQACLEEQSRHCDELAQLSHARYVLSDMVLPGHIREPLNELVARIQYQSDLAQRLPRFDRGVKALFWGKPGTGKSMAAEAIAGELQLPLYKVNLANIASKWIGETEKHLAKLFDSAQKYNAVLMFDEADAIFAKRSEVESSHDKNANMGVSYLLQRMEHYDGLLLLSTNFKSNLDDAFLRRFQSVIEFTQPGKTERLSIWQRALADNGDAMLMRDLKGLADRFEISAAQILNIASAALLLSLMDQRPAISKLDIAKALQRELSKQHAGFMAQQEMNQWLKGDHHGSNLIT